MADIHKFVQGGNYYVVDVNSGAVHLVDELVYDILDEDRLKNLDESMEALGNKYKEGDITEAYNEIQSLVKNKVLYSEDLYEDAAALHDNTPSFIKALCLNIAHDCNLRCKYCFADEGEYKGERKLMSPEIGKRSIDFVIEKSGPRKNIEVDLFGGEPLMAFETIKEIVEYAKEQEKVHNKNIRFTMTTNATLLNDEIMEYLDKNMGNIVLSIDGRKEVNDRVRVRADGSGSFDSILPRIKKMVKMRDKSKQYYARGTFTRENVDFFEDIKFLADQGFDEISVEPVVLPEKNPLSIREEDLPTIFEQYDKLYEEMLYRNKHGQAFKFYHFNIDLNGGPCVYKRISGCGAGHEYVAITPEGDIYPCHQFVGNRDFKMGNLENFNNINESISGKFKNSHIYNKPECMKCWARFYCSGGCQANNYNFNGDIRTPYSLGCKMQKKRIECAIALKSSTMEN
ncbi:MAG: thioether cross-link-forming SCIFF peptide maturase [Clostridium sp.]|uniref:thioether cross-link-forming SCIFF peptide maturase n=1 Tax=Clostridium sp. TaxID=1506 RepID=UPI0025BC448F|nr:thioether cross-link-forming SCIFF peptide maturase [Clostridium sp.]MCH3962888.1 thioether cross-link-forming SCIFF peptide maturase [Clostridium sp.]MCI1715697.1 thioether cross-link-forming SCIFF peptide maturase [Clostridium sp.]MCI1800098.1 thioether cross-link-forming SCIFF peptide maturase [Clostridium sp.]MCI1814012.1 thioether cross-link-forming SCIFF peptide maturase [Clostridium sp.]MCI1870910.1 thioether cross-link-forming SCIFF peptide maturase [Clostridium sp.]